MAEPTDIDAVIAEARSRTYSPSAPSRLIARLADALESTAAELRQERERADEWKSIYQASDTKWRQYECQMQSDLARAREVIRVALTVHRVDSKGRSLRDDAATAEMRRILATYDQKEQT